MNNKAVAMPIAIFYGVLTTMLVFIIFLILTPVWNFYANQLTGIINTFIVRFPNMSATQTQLSTLTVQWGIMFFISFLAGGIVTYVSTYSPEEPDTYFVTGSSDEYE